MKIGLDECVIRLGKGERISENLADHLETVNIVLDRGQPVAAGLHLPHQLFQKGGLTHSGVADHANNRNHEASILAAGRAGGQ